MVLRISTFQSQAEREIIAHHAFHNQLRYGCGTLNVKLFLDILSHNMSVKEMNGSLPVLGVGR